MKVQLLQTQPSPKNDGTYRQKWILSTTHGKARILTKTDNWGYTIQGPNPTFNILGLTLTAHNIISIFLHTPIDDGQEQELTENHLEMAIDKGLI